MDGLMPTVDPVAAATYFVQTLGCTAFPVWGSRNGKCLCGDPHDGTGKQGQGTDNIGKHPATLHGFKDATADLTSIRTFLANPGTPNYGLNAPPGVLVIDVDGKDGMAKWDQLQLEHGPLPVTLTTTTANGRHYFYRWPESAGPLPSGKLFGFVVRRHDDGYVIGPGSVHPTGVEYGTLRQPDGMPYGIEELPAAWATAALKPPDVITIGGRGDPAAVPVGSRHDWLRNTARLYAGTVRDPDALFAAVWTENQKLAEPKTEADVRRAIGDVLKRFGPDPVEQVVDQETGEITTQRVDAEGAALMTPRDDADLFPEPPAEAAFGGLLGQMVDCMAEGTDASRVAMLASLLAFSGALVPSWSYFHGRQTSSPFLALVGHSGIGRKGTAMYRARDALGNSLGTATVNKVRFDGLASGEAVVKALYDRAKDVFGHPTGVLFEEEYATFLAAGGREGSTLDTRMRSAFDGNQLAHRKVNDTITVPEPYWLSGLVAITPAELQEKVPRGSFKSGSGNRWLWLPVLRRAVTVVSSEPILPMEITEQLLAAHQDATREPPRLYPGPGVSELLSEYDQFLWAGSVGIEADMTRRFGVIAYRIAMVHAGVEQSSVVTQEHVTRALALTEYARAGMAWTFGQALGDGMATYLLRQLQEEGSIPNWTISKYMIRDAQKRQQAVDELCRLGLAEVAKVNTGGRTRTELRLIVRNGGFRDFRALIDYRAHTPSTNNHAQPSVGGTAQKGAERGKSAQPIAHKGAEAERSSSPAESAQKRAEAPLWLSPCDDYQAHRSAHHSTPNGWVCAACNEALCRICGDGPFDGDEQMISHRKTHGAVR